MATVGGGFCRRWLVVLVCGIGIAMIGFAVTAASARPVGLTGIQVDSPPTQTIRAGENISLRLILPDNDAPKRLRLAVDGHPRYAADLVPAGRPGGGRIDAEIRTVAVSGDYLDPGRYGIMLAVDDAAPVRIGEVVVESTAGETGLAATVAAHRAYLESNRAGLAAAATRRPNTAADSSPPAPHEPAVPAPFRPIEVSGTALEVVGRRIVIGDNGLPAQIDSAGWSLLREPIALRTASGAAMPAEPLRFSAASPDRVQWRATTKAAGIRLGVEGTLEYDGFIHYRVTAYPDDEGRLPPLTLSVPLAGAQAEYVSWLGGGALPTDKRVPGWSRASAYDARRLAEGCEAMPFSFQYVVAGDAAGLLFAIESDRDWPLDQRDSHVSVCRTGDGATLEVQIVDHPLLVDGPVSVEFALQPLPVKRLPDPARMQEFNPVQFPDAMLPYRRGSWRSGSAGDSLRFAGRPETAGRRSAWESAVAEGLRTVVVHQGWTELQGYPGTLDPGRLEALRRLTEDAHAAGLKVLAYVGLELSEAAPEWPHLAERIAALPLRFGRTRGATRSVRPSGGSAEYARFLLGHLRVLRQQTGIDGVFLDLIPEPQVSVNERAGMGYQTADGSYRGTLPLFGNRELLKGIHRLFHDSSDEPGIVACHAAGPHRPAHGFCDYILAGETEVADAHRRGGVRLTDSLPLDVFRALYSPSVRGVPVIWLSKPERGGPSINANAAVTLLHDVPQRAQWPHFIPADSASSMMNPPREVQRQWQVWRSGTITDFHGGRRYPYWSNGDWVEGLPQDVHASFRVYTNPARIEAVVSNLGSMTQDFDLRFESAGLGLAGPPLQARDLLDDEPLLIRAGAVRLVVEGDSFRIIQLRYRDRARSEPDPVRGSPQSPPAAGAPLP